MKAFFVLVTCSEGCTKNVLALCEGKEHIPALVDAIVFPENACGIEDAYEVEIPSAYILADQS
jgi:hypothetical protein